MDAKPTSIQSLTDYPAVARAFVKANATLPRSVAVEDFFSMVGMILSPRRCRMSDYVSEVQKQHPASCKRDNLDADFSARK